MNDFFLGLASWKRKTSSKRKLINYHKLDKSQWVLAHADLMNLSKYEVGAHWNCGFWSREPQVHFIIACWSNNTRTTGSYGFYISSRMFYCEIYNDFNLTVKVMTKTKRLKFKKMHFEYRHCSHCFTENGFAVDCIIELVTKDQLVQLIVTMFRKLFEKLFF